mgnify:CR=1 FL=1
MGSKGIKFKDTTGNNIYPCPYFPIGGIYISATNIDPSNYFGGKWKQIKDVFLLCAGDTYKAGTTGGEATHKLSIDEMPKHNHSLIFDQSFAPGTNGVRTGVQTAYTDQSAFIGYKGGDKPHNNMPPYIAVYVWTRIA